MCPEPEGEGATPARPMAGSPIAPPPPWARTLVRWLDDGLRVPGTDVRFGLDPILGALLPGVGDAAGGAASVALLILALERGVPTATLFRMVLNIAIDATVGSLPVAGDLFDVFYRANRKNLDLLEAQAARGEKASPLDRLLLALGVLLALAGVAIPLVALYLVGSSLWGALRSAAGL